MDTSKLVGLVGASALLAFATNAYSIPFADNVISFSGNVGFGVIDQSGGAYAGAAGPGVYDPLAVTALDGAALALGGGVGPGGQIVVSFTTGAVVDGTGVDLRLYDTFRLWEGIIAEASADGLTEIDAT